MNSIQECLPIQTKSKLPVGFGHVEWSAGYRPALKTTFMNMTIFYELIRYLCVYYVRIYIYVHVYFSSITRSFYTYRVIARSWNVFAGSRYVLEAHCLRVTVHRAGKFLAGSWVSDDLCTDIFCIFRICLTV